MTQSVRVATAGLKVVLFSAICRWLARVAGKELTGELTAESLQPTERGKGKLAGRCRSKRFKVDGLKLKGEEPKQRLRVVTSSKTLEPREGHPLPCFL